jgi:hypothetical protein
MLYFTSLFISRTGRANFQFLVNLPGIGIDDGDAEMFGYVDTETRLADGCGACDNDERFVQLPDDSAF